MPCRETIGPDSRRVLRRDRGVNPAKNRHVLRPWGENSHMTGVPEIKANEVTALVPAARLKARQKKWEIC